MVSEALWPFRNLMDVITKGQLRTSCACDDEESDELRTLYLHVEPTESTYLMVIFPWISGFLEIPSSRFYVSKMSKIVAPRGCPVVNWMPVHKSHDSSISIRPSEQDQENNTPILFHNGLTLQCHRPTRTNKVKSHAPKRQPRMRPAAAPIVIRTPDGGGGAALGGSLS